MADVDKHIFDKINGLRELLRRAEAFIVHSFPQHQHTEPGCEVCNLLDEINFALRVLK